MVSIKRLEKNNFQFKPFVHLIFLTNYLFILFIKNFEAVPTKCYNKNIITDKY